MPVSKKRAIKSLENLTEDLRELLKEQYPNGYETSITRITNAKKEPIFVFPLETEEAIYLIKVPATKNSEGEYDVESNPVTEFEKTAATAEEPAEFPAEDGFSNESEGEDFDEEGGGERKSREASYDPDFDN